MKNFITWLVVFVLCFAGLSTGYHLHKSRSPDQVLIAIDTSFPMRKAERDLNMELVNLAGRRYTRYTVIDSLSLLQENRNTPVVRREIIFFGPRELVKLAENAIKYSRSLGVDRVIFFTNAADISPLDGVPESEVRVLD